VDAAPVGYSPPRWVKIRLLICAGASEPLTVVAFVTSRSYSRTVLFGLAGVSSYQTSVDSSIMTFGSFSPVVVDVPTDSGGLLAGPHDATSTIDDEKRALQIARMGRMDER